jgi:hypothetical protein
MADELGVLADRAGWTVSGSSAICAPPSGGWSSRVRPLAVPGRSSYAPFHIAIVAPGGAARYVCQAISVHEATRVAERRVQAAAGPVP